MNLLPKDILLIIIEFDGRFKYRHGKLMTKISKTDPRLLLTIAPPTMDLELDYVIPTYRATIIFKNEHSLQFVETRHIYPHGTFIVFKYKYNDIFVSVFTIMLPKSTEKLENMKDYSVITLR